ncbi:uncharacterized protein PHALS_05641 [Plasmopara halstedii]|uniref:Uncharacterized protein n=1 Tax=Plasmopara halstedii TaxID=4781 RepID=A0A0N7L7W0_PLAHL|nr:uncharacterized protein PHALS_05641 [Plasmopara halstedii]CEG48171.1 hypothetical protein PHALS_05641 [Plasmopara halstedii]|eukprot:XP_024584540.1 hypothetical protein PHALS_05641 [Plasmopara halstedii]
MERLWTFLPRNRRLHSNNPDCGAELNLLCVSQRGPQASSSWEWLGHVGEDRGAS